MLLLQVEKESVQTTYTENDRSMLRYIYDCVFFVARKPADLHVNGQEENKQQQQQQQSSPPAAKSPRREDTDSLTWQEILWLKTVNLEDWGKTWLTKTQEEDGRRRKKSDDINFLLWRATCRTLQTPFVFVGQMKHLIMTEKTAECNMKCSNIILRLSTEKQCPLIGGFQMSHLPLISV